MVDLSKFEQITKPPFFNNIPFLREEHFSFRYEYKYFITADMYENLRQKIKPIFEIDKNCLNFSHRSYPIRSVYWDTENLTCYNQKVDGIRHRYKYRYRIYVEKFNSDPELYVEVKGKDGRKITKYRTPIRWSLLQHIKKNKNYFSQDDLPHEKGQEIVSFLEWEQKMFLTPVIAVRYEREAYQYLRDDKVRVNFDREIYFKKVSSIEDIFSDISLWQKMDFSNLIIFEIKIKSHHILPYEVKNIITATNLEARAISKYCYGVERCGLITGANGLIEASEGGEGEKYVRKIVV